MSYEIRSDRHWRISKSGYSIKTGFTDSTRIVASYHAPHGKFDARRFEQWLEDAQHACDLHNASIDGADEIVQLRAKLDATDEPSPNPELRRLLELAAMACGYQLDADGDRVDVRASGGEPMPWRPDTDDGDSARMRSSLRMTVKWCIDDGKDEVWCWVPTRWGAIEDNERIADHNGDSNAALRLCALRVAAMIREGMK